MKGVIAVNTSFARVKRPVSFKLIWPTSKSVNSYNPEGSSSGTSRSIKTVSNTPDSGKDDCSIWFPVAPKGYVALGCVVSAGRTPPPLSSALCILASLVSPSSLKDCITLSCTEQYVLVKVPFSSSAMGFYVLATQACFSFLITDIQV